MDEFDIQPVTLPEQPAERVETIGGIVGQRRLLSGSRREAAPSASNPARRHLANARREAIARHRFLG